MLVSGKPSRPQPQSPFREDCLRGLVVLVTGGGSGIGLGISEAFAAHGACLTLFGRRAAVLEESCRSLRERWPSCVASACRGDVRDPDSCAAAVAACLHEHGRLDVLVNCAAGNFMCAAEELTPKAFRTVVDIDMQGTYNMCSAALGALSGPRRRPATAGSPLVINISATLHYKALPFQAHACAAKAGIDALTSTLGLEYGCEHGVRVVGIGSCREPPPHRAPPPPDYSRPEGSKSGGLEGRPARLPRPMGGVVFRLAGRPWARTTPGPSLLPHPYTPPRHRAWPDRGHGGRADGARLRRGDRGAGREGHRAARALGRDARHRPGCGLPRVGRGRLRQRGDARGRRRPLARLGTRLLAGARGPSGEEPAAPLKALIRSS